MESKKISELEQYNGSANGFMVPGVADGETQKADLGAMVDQAAGAAGYLKPSGLKTINGESIAGSGDLNVAVMNPLKGTYLDTDTLPATGQDGDYIYVVNTSVTPRTANVYAWDGTAFADTGKSVEDFGLQFASGQTIPDTGIKDLNGNNDSNAAGVLSAEAGKELKEDLYGEDTEVVGEDLIAAGKVNTSSNTYTRMRMNPGGVNVIVYVGSSSFSTTYIGNNDWNEIKANYSKLRVTAKTNRDGYIIFAKKSIENADATFAQLSEDGYVCTGVTSETFFNRVPMGETKDIVIPSDAERIYIADRIDSNTDTGRVPASIVPIAIRTVGGRLNELQQEIDDSVVKVEEIKGHNLCNPDEIVDGYVNGSNGNVASSESYRATGYIPIDEEGLTCPLSYQGGTVIGYAYYNADKMRIAGYYAGSYLPGCNMTYANYQEGAKYVRFTIQDKTSNVMVSKGTRIWGYEPYEGTAEVISPDMLPEQQSGKLEMLLPDKFYHVAGDTLQLFYRGMIRTTDMSGKFVNPTCGIGVSYCRMFETNVGSNYVGTKRLTINVYDENRNNLARGVTTIQVVQAPVNPDSKKHVLLLGGSFIDNNTIYTELNRRLTGAAGTGSPAAAGLSEDRIAVHKIGHSGWGWYDYTHNNRSNPSNPFWINGQVDVAAWVASQNWGTGETLDVIYAIFAYNGLYSYSVDDFRGYIETFIGSLPEGCTLVLAAPVLPNVQLSKMTNDNAADRESDAYLGFCKVWEIYKMYKQVASEHTNVEFESFAAQFDMEYGYPLTTPHAVNIRKTDVTIPVVSNTIHPSDNVGYLQLADAAYRSVVAHFCQSNS